MKKYLLIARLLMGLMACAHKPPELEGAINKDKIPVYANSELDPGQALAGADTEGDYGAFYAKYWDLKTSDPPEKVVEFYKKALPSAKVEKTDEGDTVFSWDFPGAEKGESIEIRVKPGLIHIAEDLKAGKHKR